MIDAKLLTHGGQKKFTYWPACAVFTVFGASIRLTVNHPRALWKITWCALPNSLWIANTQLGYIFIYNLMSSSATPEILLGRKFEHSGLHIAHSRHLIMLRPKPNFVLRRKQQNIRICDFWEYWLKCIVVLCCEGAELTTRKLAGEHSASVHSSGHQPLETLFIHTLLKILAISLILPQFSLNPGDAGNGNKYLFTLLIVTPFLHLLQHILKFYFLARLQNARH